MFNARRLLTPVLLAVLLSTSACEREQSDRALGQTVFATRDSQDTPTAHIAAKQRNLQSLLASSDVAAAQLIARDVTLYDALRPEDRTRDWQGRVAWGQDYFRLLAREFPASFAEIESLQVFPEYAGSVAVLVNHPGGQATITGWSVRDSTWKAVSLTINASDSVVAAFRERFQAILGHK